MDSKLTKSGKIAFTSPLRWIIVIGIIFFLSAGDYTSLRAWIYFVLYGLGGLIMNIILLRKSPQLLNDRGKMQEGTKKKDKAILVGYFSLALIVSPLMAGLDYRYSILDILPFYYLYLAIFLYIITAIFSIWPMLANPFFEGTIRIQKDKSHKVIDTGPYQFIRHPGYVAMSLGAITLPIALGSIFSLIPALIMIILVLYRTAYEDKILQKELDGYAEYAQRVKYRLVPFIW
jgi:protein-S-isoprenylcysteine O-methyltransferase Ste14